MQPNDLDLRVTPEVLDIFQEWCDGEEPKDSGEPWRTIRFRYYLDPDPMIEYFCDDPASDDIVVSVGGIDVLIEPESADYLQRAELYVDTENDDPGVRIRWIPWPLLSESDLASQPKRPISEKLHKSYDRHGDEKLREALMRAMPTATRADESLMALFWVTDKIEYAPSIKQWIAFTQFRFAMGGVSGMFGGGSPSQTFSKEALDTIAVGESDHTEYRGVASPVRSTFLTLRLSFVDGRRMERHIYLGEDEKRFNEVMPGVVERLQKLPACKYRVVDGGGWSNTGGFTTSFGMGFGMWTH
jgi:hypothetical protein